MRTERWLAATACVCGTLAWIVYFEQDLVLSHYDAKAHLVVARRVIDSLTPGWQQLGAVWLPLPHLLQLFPTQLDVLYRTGAFGSALSIAAFAVTVWAVARIVLAMTGSALGAATAGLILLLNPNLLYLQSTPMTEPLLLALTALAILWLYEWLSVARMADAPVRLKWALFAAMWTRYEAWPVVAAALTIAAYVTRTKPGFPVLRLAAWPLAAALIFVVNSRVTVGSWFVSGGFYERDPIYDGQIWRSLVAVWWGTHQLSGYLIETVALVMMAAITVRALRGSEAKTGLVPVALFAAAALPFYAFYEGHPFRVRYMVPMVAACALFSGLAVGTIQQFPARGLFRGPRYAAGVAVLLIGSSLVESPPWNANAPMVAEAQWDVPHSRERRAVTECLALHYRGELVMASMGSLAHYMQELSHAGLEIADFLHEGNGVIWDFALQTGPAAHVGWMLIEEQSEGGDVLARRLRQDATFARRMARVCEGGGVALYRRAGN